MMQIEKNLSQTNLNKFKTEPLKLLVKQLYKYQDFKCKVMLTQINMMNFKQSTIIDYHRKIRRYLKEGFKQSGFSAIYNYVDEFKNSGLTPLRPAEENRIREYNYKKNDIALSPTPIKIEEPPKYIEIVPDQYGVKCENTIKLFDSKEWALGYLDCYKAIGDGKPVELIKVKFEVVEI